MNKTIGNIFKGDKVIWIVFFMLCMISLVEVFSASSNLTYKSNNFIMPIMKHALMLAIGGFIAVVITNIPCRYFKLATPFLILISFATLLWVLFAGESINGANRVIEIAGQTFQPSEIAKGTIILAEAQILSAMQTERGADRQAFKFILIIALPMIRIGKPLDGIALVLHDVPCDVHRSCAYDTAWKVGWNMCRTCLGGIAVD